MYIHIQELQFTDDSVQKMVDMEYRYRMKCEELDSVATKLAEARRENVKLSTMQRSIYSGSSRPNSASIHQAEAAGNTAAALSTSTDYVEGMTTTIGMR